MPRCYTNFYQDRFKSLIILPLYSILPVKFAIYTSPWDSDNYLENVEGEEEDHIERASDTEEDISKAVEYWLSHEEKIQGVWSQRRKRLRFALVKREPGKEEEEDCPTIHLCEEHIKWIEDQEDKVVTEALDTIEEEGIVLPKGM